VSITILIFNNITREVIMSNQFTSQRAAARHFVQAYCEEKQIEFGGDMKEKLSKDDQRNIVTIMATAAVEGLIHVKSDRYNDQKSYEKYFKGQLNDALRKDTQLNGGEQYVAKNPGKFKNAKDPQIKALNTLLKTKPEHADEINEAIAARQAELDAEKRPELSDEDKEMLKNIGLGNLVD
jgi:hypothetical protein